MTTSALGVVGLTALGATGCAPLGSVESRGRTRPRPPAGPVTVTVYVPERLLSTLEAAARAASDGSNGQYHIELRALPASAPAPSVAPGQPGQAPPSPPSLSPPSPSLPAIRGVLGANGVQGSSRPGQGARVAGTPSGSAAAAADVVVLQRPEDLLDLVAEGLVQGLERFFRTHNRVQQEALDGFSPGALEALRIRGALYGLPLAAAPVVLQYDPKLFDAAGVPRPDMLPSGAWTWQALLDAARRLTRDTDGDGKIDVYGLVGGIGPVEMWVWQAGGEVVSPDGRRSLLAEPPAVEALAFYEHLLNAGVRGQVPPGDRPVFAADGVHLGTAPDAPRAAMLFGSPSAVSFGPEWPLRIAEVPRGRRQATSMRLESAFALAMATTTSQPALAYAAMLALAVEAQRHVATPTRAPSVAHLRDSPAGTIWHEEELQAYVASLKYARSLPLAQQRAIQDALATYVTVPLSGGTAGTANPAALGAIRSRTPEQAAREAAAAIDELLRRQVAS